MDTCPNELIAYILHLACTDAGITFRALSTVSKRFHELVRPLQYHTVSITGAGQAIELAKRLTSNDLPPHMRRIRHLFLSDQPARTPDDTAKTAIILHILILAAPTLHTLTLHTSNPSSSTSTISALFSIRFPTLSHLSITGFYPFPHLRDSLPSLRSLHLRGNRNPHGLFQTAALHSACPNLTHLRVSGLTMAASFADELADAINQNSNPEHTTAPSSSPFAPRLPPLLRTVVVQPAPLTDASSRFRSINSKEERMMRRLTELSSTNQTAAAHHPPGPKVVLCERETEVHDAYELARREWCRRLDDDAE